MGLTRQETVLGQHYLKWALRVMFLAIEVNLVLWLVMWGVVLAADSASASVKITVAVGTVFAAIVQHWAYYAVYKRVKRMQKRDRADSTRPQNP